MNCILYFVQKHYRNAQFHIAPSYVILHYAITFSKSSNHTCVIGKWFTRP